LIELENVFKSCINKEKRIESNEKVSTQLSKLQISLDKHVKENKRLNEVIHDLNEQLNKLKLILNNFQNQISGMNMHKNNLNDKSKTSSNSNNFFSFARP